MIKIKTKLITIGMIFSMCILLPMQVNANELVDLSNIPEYTGEAYVEINDNVPDFSERMITAAKTKAYETYKALDKLKRCGVCVASIDQSIMPTEERGSIGQVKPTGWQTVKYNDQIDGNYLYNRCHLIGYQLTGENTNKKNIVTGTRYLNVDGMLPYENKVADYLEKSKNNKVLYRVTPIFEGDNLVCSGVQMEALSLNDNGKAINFNVYCYNVQPGINIDYATGKSSLSPTWQEDIKKAVGATSVKGASKANSASKKSTQQSTTEKEAVVATQVEETPAPVQEPAPQVEAPVPVQESAPQVESPAPASEPVVASGAMVWLSATGEKYHSINNCGRMNPAKATQVTEQDAINKGKTKCSKCW